MSNILSITQMSPADAVATNEKIQVVVADVVATHGEEGAGAAVIDAAADLDTATADLEQTEAATFRLRKEVDTSADRCLGAIINCCKDTVSTYESAVVPLTEPQQQALDSAHWLMERCFPDGRGFILNSFPFPA